MKVSYLLKINIHPSVLMLVLLFIVLNLRFAHSQKALISSYFNANSPSDEWTEIIVNQDDVNMTNWTLRDNAATQSGSPDGWQLPITFVNPPSNPNFWNHMRRGTIIIIRHRQYNSIPVLHRLDANKADGYLELHANDPNYFSGGDFGPSPTFSGPSLNISQTGDILQLRDASSNHIHALGHRSSPGVDWINLPVPKINHTNSVAMNQALMVSPGTDSTWYGNPAHSGTSLTILSSGGVYTRGLPNNTSTNSDFWRSLRQPDWINPVLTATTQNGGSILLSWNQATDPYSFDGTQGYILLKNTSFSFPTPTDGIIYGPGDLGGIVLDTINSSSITSYLDNSTVNCGSTVYYKIFPYRYLKDDSITMNDLARGRAYSQNKSDTTKISFEIGPIINSILTQHPTCGLDNGSITVLSTSNYNPTTYSIDNGSSFQSNNEFLNLPAGTYYILVRDNNGCISSYVNNPVELISASTVTDIEVISVQPSCFTNNGSISITVTGGVQPILYSIDDGITYQVTSVFNSLLPGTYYIKVKDDNNCETSYISNPVELSNQGGVSSLNISTTPELCFQANGTIIISASGGIPPLQYSIDGGLTWQTSNVFNNLSAGNYNVIVEDDNNCQTVYSSNPVVVAFTSGSIINGVSITNSNCGLSNGIIIVDASGGTSPLSYSIDNGITWSPNNVFSNLAAGSYIVSVLDNNNCVTEYGSNPVFVGSEGGAIIDDVITSPELCGTMNGTITIAANGGVQPLQYSIDGGISWFNTPNFNSLSAGLYNIAVTDFNNCLVYYDENPVEVLSSGGATITGVVTSIDSCGASKGIILVYATSGVSPLSFSIDNGSTWQSSSQFSNLPSGDYFVQVRDDLNCVTSYLNNPVFIGLLEGAIISGINTQPENCGYLNGSINITVVSGSPPFQYSIDGGSNWQIAPTFNGLSAGDYTIVVKDNNQCLSINPSNPVQVQSLGGATLSTPTVSNTTCSYNNGSITINASGGVLPYEYSIDGGTTWQSSKNFQQLYANTYSISVRDANSCTTNGSPVIIIDSPAPIINSMITTEAINNQANGSLVCTATGTAPLEFSINGSNWYPTGNFSNLAPGSYTLSVRDGNTCITTTPFIIANSSLAGIILDGDTASACPFSNVTISFYGSGITDIRSFDLCFSFDPAMASYNGITSVHPDLINVITDSSIPGRLQMTWDGATNVTIPDGDLVFRLRFRGKQTGLVPIEWNDFLPGICGVFNDAGAPMLFNYSPGAADFLQMPQAIISGDTELCLGEPVELTALGDTLDHVWTLPDGTLFNGHLYQVAVSSIADTGSYRLLATNTIGCIDKDTVQVSVTPPPVISLAGSDSLCAEAMYEFNPGSGYASYLWQDGSTLPTFTATGEGLYWVQVTDAAGCNGADTVSLVTCPAKLHVPNAFSPNFDSYNDYFRARYSDVDVLEDFKLLIYNRWGQLLFETTDIHSGWDGTFKGVNCPMGVYTYVIYFKKPEGKTMAEKSPYRGLVTLIR